MPGIDHETSGGADCKFTSAADAFRPADISVSAENPNSLNRSE
jgi:hypothetical protein